MPIALSFDKELLPIANKVMKIIHSVPKINGHFWIERDGLIIDPHFKEYDSIKLEHKAKKFIYSPTDETTQGFMINIFLKNILKDYTNLTEFLNDYKKIVGEKPLFSFCIYNALIEQEKNGGKLIFGSYGLERADGSRGYICGDDSFTGVSAFLKTRTFLGKIVIS
jgi:hypothetical protein